MIVNMHTIKDRGFKFDFEDLSKFEDFIYLKDNYKVRVRTQSTGSGNETEMYCVDIKLDESKIVNNDIVDINLLFAIIRDRIDENEVVYTVKVVLNLHVLFDENFKGTGKIKEALIFAKNTIRDAIRSHDIIYAYTPSLQHKYRGALMGKKFNF